MGQDARTGTLSTLPEQLLNLRLNDCLAHRPADDHRTDDALPIDEEGRRQPTHLIAPAHPTLAVEQDGKGQPKVLDECHHVRFRVLKGGVYAEDNQPSALESLVCRCDA